MKRQIVLADIGIALGMRDIEHWIELEDAAASFEDVELRTMLGVGPHQTRHPYLVIRFDRVQRLDLVDRAAEIRIALVGFVVDAELVFPARSEEHTSELQSLMRISYAVFCLKKKNKSINTYVHIKT